MRTILSKAQENGKPLGFILLIVALILRFAYWQIHPSLASAAIFWGFSIAGWIFRIPGEIWEKIRAGQLAGQLAYVEQYVTQKMLSD